MPKKHLADRVLLFLLALLLAGGALSLCLFPCAEYSPSENRTLAQFPTVTWQTLRDGSVSSGLDLYAAERAPFRTALRRLWGGLGLTLGLREADGVILCRDGSLLRRLPVNEAAFAQNLAALTALQAKLEEAPLTFAVAPRRIDARKSVLPTLYNTAREDAVWQRLPEETVTFADCTDDAHWFHTDHHWTAAGAYTAYVHLGTYLGYTPLPKEFFSEETVSNSFLGTSEAAAPFPNITPDEIVLFRAENDVHFRVRRDGENADFTGLYDRQKLEERDQYAVFLGGNCGVLEIDLGDADDRPMLFMIRDSFAGALLPFLAQHYRVIALDPRYATQNISPLLARADHTLLLCGLQTLIDAPFLPALLRSIRQGE